MMLFRPPELAPPVPCPYLPDREFRQEYFLAHSVSPEEFEELLASGWRRFGYFFFRPRCEACRECVPLRIPVADFMPSKSQRRVMRKNAGTVFEAVPLEYSDELFALYRDHSRERFGREADEGEFRESFFFPAAEALLARYIVDGKLAAAGFVDVSARALSSVYFVYGAAAAQLSPGNYGAIREIFFARERGLEYYYIGYHVEGNHSMEYKNRFHPHQLMDWETGDWRTVDRPGE